MQLFSLYYEILTYAYSIILKYTFFMETQKHLMTFFICYIEIVFAFREKKDPRNCVGL